LNKENAAMELELDAKKTALVAIDLEHMIVGRPHLAPYGGAEVVARSKALADALRAKGGTVVWVHVLLNEVARLPVDSPMQMSGELPPNAAELVPEIGLQPGDVVIGKRQWGAFYGTNLEQALDRRGIETIIMSGIATNMGVESTARAAYDAGYALVFAEDAMTTMGAEWHEFSVKNLFPRMGRVRTTEEIVAAL
jgi:nicotinamidase-related amidase